MTPTLTKLEHETLKLLIRFAWGITKGGDYHDARKLVIKALELDDDRPVDTEKRKAALNGFLLKPTPQS